jgi:sigma-E factor negative regulatory protein RseA
MNSASIDTQARRQLMSALADGEATAAEVGQAVQAWRDDSQARDDWATYQLIGDALRSDDLAQPASSDRFLSKLRDRLAQEPVVLAPQAAAQVAAHVAPSEADAQAVRASASTIPSTTHRPARPRAWAGPLAVAAAFVAVLGGVLTLQVPSFGPAGGPDGGVTLAQSAGATPSLATGLSWASTGTPMAQSFVARSQSAPKDAVVDEAHTMPVGLVQSGAASAAAGTELVWLIR